jgi:hypothetical protein
LREEFKLARVSTFFKNLAKESTKISLIPRLLDSKLVKTAILSKKRNKTCIFLQVKLNHSSTGPKPTLASLKEESKIQNKRMGSYLKRNKKSQNQF